MPTPRAISGWSFYSRSDTFGDIQDTTCEILWLLVS